jgi:hypothetical protein
MAATNRAQLTRMVPAITGSSDASPPPSRRALGAERGAFKVTGRSHGRQWGQRRPIQLHRPAAGRA